MKTPFQPAFLGLLVAMLWLTTPAISQDHVAIENVETGDRVEVKFLGDWVKAEVVDVVNNHLIKTKFVHPRTHREMTFRFTEKNVRFIDKPPSVKNADSAEEKTYPKEMRKWTSSNGEFSVEARIIEIDNGNLLLKRKDGKTVRVPTIKLSDLDQKYLKSLEKPENPFDNIVPEKTSPPISNLGPRPSKKNKYAEFALTEPDQSESQLVSSSSIKPWSLLPATIPDHLVLKNPIELSAMPNNSHVAHFGIDRKSKRGLICLDGFMRKNGRVVLVDLNARKEIASHELPMQECKIHGVSPDGLQVLTSYSNRVDFWKPTAESLVHVTGWQVPNGGGNFSEITKAVFIGNDKIATADRKKNLYVWRIDGAKLLFEKQVGPFGPGGLAVTHDKKNLIFAGDRMINVLNLETGEINGAAEHMLHSSTLAISQEGKLAACSGNQVTIWDPDGKQVDQFIVTGAFGFEKQSRWLDEQFLLARTAPNQVVVIDTENRVTLAKYNLGRSSVSIDESGQFWLVDSSNGKSRIGTAKIEPEKYLDRLPAFGDDLQVLRDGQTVDFDFQLPFQPEEIDRIKEHIESQLIERGIEVVATGGDITIRMMSVKGKPYEIETRSIGFRGFGRRPFGGTKATVTPNSMRMDMMLEGRAIWSKSATTGIVGIIQSKDDETVQQAIDRITRAKPGFFKTTIPEKIAIHPAQGAYAVVRLGLNGILSEKYDDLNLEQQEDF